MSRRSLPMMLCDLLSNLLWVSLIFDQVSVQPRIQGLSGLGWKKPWPHFEEFRSYTMSRIVFTGIVLELVLLSAITDATCCHEIKDYVENRTVAYNVLCSNNDRLRDCCRVIEEDICKHTQAYRTICPNHSRIKISYLCLIAAS